MNAHLLAEAVDTACALFRAAVAWWVLMSVAATLALYAVTVITWATARGVWRACAWLYRRLRGELPPHAPTETPEPRSAPQARRRVPAWAHTDHHDDVEEAA